MYFTYTYVLAAYCNQVQFAKNTSEKQSAAATHISNCVYTRKYRGADKSLARPWKETSYSDQDSQHYANTYGIQTTGIYCCCLYPISLGIVL